MTAGAIIAGGHARRFGGADKSRLVVQGEAIISRQLAALRPIAAEIFLVVDADARRARFADLGVPVHVDLVPGAGALGGIYTALEVATAAKVVTLACDLPFLTTALLARLADLADRADAAWVRSRRGVEPLIACYQRAARDVIRRELAAGRFKAADLSRVLRIEELSVAEVETFGPAHRLLANINTPDEYAEIAGNHASHGASIVSHGSAPPGTRSGTKNEAG
jgi:molybdopterin-guanine dinucleotide biosynthesis protein A